VVARYTGSSPLDSWTAFVLCDGIGGLRDGGICARKAIAAFLTDFLGEAAHSLFNRLTNAARSANNELFSLYRSNGGSTISCFVFDQRKNAAALNVGDTRIYACDGRSVTQISVDDTLASQISNIQKLEASKSSPFAKQLTQFLGIGPEIQFRELRTDNRSEQRGYLLTSDGVHGLWNDVIKEIVPFAPTPSDVVKRLLALSRWGRANDNATAVFFSTEVEGADEPRGPAGSMAIWDSFARLDLIIDHSVLGTKEFDRKTKEKPPTKKRDKPESPGTEEKIRKADSDEKFTLEIFEERDGEPPN
jgi:PPM family protein phosphatase